MNLADIQQRTDEWHQIRLGKLTASVIHEVVAKTKTGYSASREQRAVTLALEILLGRREETYTNAAMMRGTEMEPFAAMAYEAYTGMMTEEIGFVIHPRLERSGASPDRLVGDDGLVEIKCPTSAQHLRTLMSKKADKKYVDQMQWQMACTGRKWCDFVSYDDRFPAHLQLCIVRYQRDDKYIEELESEVLAFTAEVDEIVGRLQKLAA